MIEGLTQQKVCRERKRQGRDAWVIVRGMVLEAPCIWKHTRGFHIMAGIVRVTSP